MWPHKMVYTAASKAVVYSDISIMLFIQDYMIVMDEEKETVRANMASHLKDLIVDLELYGRDRVRAYHAVWLNQMEQGRVS